MISVAVVVAITGMIASVVFATAETGVVRVVKKVIKKHRRVIVVITVMRPVKIMRVVLGIIVIPGKGSVVISFCPGIVIKTIAVYVIVIIIAVIIIIIGVAIFIGIIIRPVRPGVDRAIMGAINRIGIGIIGIIAPAVAIGTGAEKKRRTGNNKRDFQSTFERMRHYDLLTGLLIICGQ